MKLFLLNLGRGSVVRAQLCPSATLITTRTSRSRANTWLMRLSLAYSILIASSIQLLARTTNGQTIDKEVVTIELQNDGLVAMVKKIEAQSTLRFIYLPEQLSRYGSVSLVKAKRTVRETLDLALVGTGVTYEQSGRYIVLRDRAETASNASALKESGLSASLVKGHVTDQDGQGIAGVNIVIKGTTTGTTTDKNGDYGILAESNDVLVFSFIGCKTVEVGVTSRTTVDMTLEADIATLGSVEVNAGYWTVDERKTTGSISTITSEEIGKQPVSNPLAALEGRMPGVYVQQTTGMPGGGINIQIRGRNSIRNAIGDNGNLPLYIIDGVPFSSTSFTSMTTTLTNLQGGNPLSSINPADIESIDVLKDADATAIYGSRGSNGVVLITTKRGKEGKPKFDFSASRGAGQIARKMKLMNGKQYLSMRREAFRNEGMWPIDSISQSSYSDLFAWDTTRSVDWQKELIGGTANYTNVQGSLSGGSRDIQFLLGGAVLKETTVFPVDYGNTKGSVNMHVNYDNPDNRLQASMSANYVVDDNNLPDQDLTTLVLLPPISPKIHNDDGSLNWDPSWPLGYNPFSKLKAIYKAKTNNLVANARIKYSLTRDLSIKTSFGFNSVQLTSQSITPIASMNPLQTNRAGYNFLYESDQKGWIIEPQIEYSKIIGSGIFTFLSGATFQSTSRTGQNIMAYGYTDDVLIENILSAPVLRVLNTSFVDYRYAAVFGRLNYDWKGKYIVNITGRRDGSSRFGVNNKFSNFGAVGAAWIFTDEVFFQDIKTISYGKLRSSYGITGNDQISDYGYLDTYSNSTYQYNSVPGLIPNKIANPNYSWERNKKFEAALELGFCENRVRFNTSYYMNRSSNQLVGYSLAPTAGFESVQSNRPATVQNTGLEFEIVTLNINKDAFVWSTGLNITVPRNKLISYPNLQGSSYATRLEVGQPLLISKMYTYTGVNPETGLYTFLDVDNSGTYTNADKRSVFVGQKMYGGIQNSISYKGFKIDFLVQFVQQTGYNYMQFVPTMPGSYAQNQPVAVLDRWQKTGDHTNTQKFQQLSGGDGSNAYSLAAQSDLAVESASFIRLKNISVSYTVPRSVIDPIHLRDLTVYIQAQNLFTITNYSGGDPESLNISTLGPIRLISGGIKFQL